MATIRITLDERRIKKNGTYPVVLRVYHAEKYLTIKTSIELERKHWDISSCSVLKSHPLYKQINHRLKELELIQYSKILDLHRSKPNGFSFNELKILYEKTEKPISLKEFWHNEIELLIQSHKYGNARINKIAFGVLSKIVNLDIPFTELSYTLLNSIEITLLQRGLKKNSISCYFRSLRAIYNIAINKGLVDASFYPFRRFKVRSEKTTPSILSAESLKRFFNLSISKSDPLYPSIQIGKLIFLLGGINFTDLIQLKKEDIIHDRIIYRRSKTKKVYSIKILPVTKDIIKELNKDSSSTICGILTEEELSAGERLPYIVREKNKQLNNKLARVGTICKTEVPLKSYTFRYTLANICKQMDYDMSLISELLGHNYGSSITRGYVEAYDKDKLDSMLENVVKEVTN
jgi:integrase